MPSRIGRFWWKLQDNVAHDMSTSLEPQSQDFSLPWALAEASEAPPGDPVVLKAAGFTERRSRPKPSEMP